MWPLALLRSGCGTSAHDARVQHSGAGVARVVTEPGCGDAGVER